MRVKELEEEVKAMGESFTKSEKIRVEQKALLAKLKDQLAQMKIQRNKNLEETREEDSDCS